MTDDAWMPQPEASVDGTPAEPAGDAACWLPSLCAECGAFIEGPPGTACWRCGGTRREGDD
ncbi:hypothetical protein [Microbacterium luticocti]|uniref:hypothetical protein n=1 Tax=Microbacterium luticocti TaxID=451764 RepID=UPI0004130F8F|nr:hypothetical protein [Microbacterium luticocti]